MQRRTACAALALVAAAAGPALGQGSGPEARIRLVAELPIDDAIQSTLIGPFRRGLREPGHLGGQQYVLEMRSATGRRDRLPQVIDELLKLAPDVIVAAFPAAALAVKKAPASVPVVAVGVDNPVETGLAETMP